MTYKDAIKKVLSKHKDCKCTSVLDMKSAFIVSIQPKNWNQDEMLLDPYFAVDKKTGKISEWTPIMDPEGFKEAIASGVVYKEGDSEGAHLEHSEESVSLYGALGRKFVTQVADMTTDTYLRRS